MLKDVRPSHTKEVVVAALFGKQPDSGRLFADGAWRVAQGEIEGSPVIVRVNDNLKPFVGKSDHTLKIGFAVPLNNPNPGGLPTPEENEQLGPIEDRILQVLRESGSVVEALAITMGTFKEFVFYTKPNTDVRAIHERLMDEIKTHDVQCYAEIEAKWDPYKQWADGLQAGAADSRDCR